MNCSPFLLNGTLQHHLSRHNHEEILRSLYVDDFAGGATDVCSTQKLFETLKGILNLGGFEIHKLLSNNPLVNKYFGSSKIDKDTVKVLGLTWSSSTDELMLEINDLII